MSYQPIPPTAGYPTPDERTWGMIAHLSSYAGIFIPVLGHIGGPLIVLLLRGDSPYISYHAKEAINFWITAAIVTFLYLGLCILVVGLLLLPVAFIVAFVWHILPIIAAIRAREGAAWRYPMTIRLLPER